MTEKNADFVVPGGGIVIRPENYRSNFMDGQVSYVCKDISDMQVYVTLLQVLRVKTISSYEENHAHPDVC